MSREAWIIIMKFIISMLALSLILLIAGCKSTRQEAYYKFREKTWPLELYFGDGYVEPWGNGDELLDRLPCEQ
jgi:hypothetical protein